MVIDVDFFPEVHITLDGENMNVKITQIKKKDFNTARKYAIVGMNLNRYTSNNFELYFYSKYFWYSEISKATRAYGAYIDDELVGVLLANIKNEPKIFKSIRHKLFVKFISCIIDIGYKAAAGVYDEANRQMLNSFRAENEPDGELNFFAVNPEIKGKGIGTLLLNQLEHDESGKLIYLYCDSGATFQFYQKRGFNMSGKTEIKLTVDKKEVPLTCFLFSKRF